MIGEDVNACGMNSLFPSHLSMTERYSVFSSFDRDFQNEVNSGRLISPRVPDRNFRRALIGFSILALLGLRRIWFIPP
jgi:hypothetical protein